MKSAASPKKKVGNFLGVLFFISNTTFYKSCNVYSLKGTFLFFLRQLYQKKILLMRAYLVSGVAQVQLLG